MKKSIVASLATAMVLSLTGTSFAAANSFADVPAKHWSYDSLSKLAKEGIIDGYSDGTFRGDKTITRYEMAQIVAKAMNKSDKANAEQKAAIDKLAAEYNTELTNLGVEVSNLKKTAERVQFTGGCAKLEYDTLYVNGERNQYRPNFKYQFNLDMKFKVSNQWSYIAKFEADRDFQTGKDIGDDKDYDGFYRSGWMDGKVGEVGVLIGRLDPKPGSMVSPPPVLDNYLTGARLSFGTTVKTQIWYGRIATNATNNKDFTNTPTDIGIIESAYDFNKVKVSGAYYATRKTQGAWDKNGKSYKAAQISFAAPVEFLPGVNAYGSYVKSNRDTANKYYMLGATYNNPKMGWDPSNKPGSWQFETRYVKQEHNSIICAADEMKDQGLTWYQPDSNVGVKGFSTFFRYCPAKNSALEVRWIHATALNNNDTINRTTASYTIWF